MCAGMNTAGIMLMSQYTCCQPGSLHPNAPAYDAALTSAVSATWLTICPYHAAVPWLQMATPEIINLDQIRSASAALNSTQLYCRQRHSIALSCSALRGLTQPSPACVHALLLLQAESPSHATIMTRLLYIIEAPLTPWPNNERPTLSCPH